MALNWKYFTPKKKESKKEDRSLSSDDVRNIVNQEVSTAAMKNQIVKYFDDIAAQGIRTEALLGEVKDEINKTIPKVEQIGHSLEESVHKDSLLSYKNIKEILDEIDERNAIRAKKIRGIAVWALIFSLLTLVGVAGLVLIQLGVITF